MKAIGPLLQWRWQAGMHTAKAHGLGLWVREHAATGQWTGMVVLGDEILWAVPRQANEVDAMICAELVADALRFREVAGG